MNFLAPAAFGLAILIPVIIAMYLLKLRRTEQMVSSTYLWQRMVREVEANAPWQQLRRNLLLLLQLLFLIALILALARPFSWREGATGQTAIIILDASASMGAMDAAPNRLEAAKKQALQLVDDLPDSARVTLIEAGERAQVLTTASQDRRQVRGAIQNVVVSTGGSDMATAMQLAGAIGARSPDTQIAVFSDGGVALPERLSIKGSLRYFPIGTGGDNQAISLLTLEPARGGDTLNAFVQVRNYALEPVRRRLEVYASGSLVDAHDLEIDPQGQQAVLVENLPGEVNTVEARLAGEDVLPIDDHFWAVYQDRASIAVTLVSEGNLFLETSLSLLPGLGLTRLSSEDYALGETADSPTDLVILDGTVPPTSTTTIDGPTLFIAPPESTPFFSVTGLAAAPVPRPLEPDHALLKNTTLDSVSILDAVQISLPDWANTILAGDLPDGGVTPLLMAGEVNDQRVVILSFDVQRSDLPLQVAFPLLMANLVDWLIPNQAGGLPEWVSPGAPVVFSLPIEIESANITRPDGSSMTITSQDGRFTFSDTGQPGVYQVEWGEGGGGAFAVNISSPQESDVRPEGTLAIAGLDSDESGQDGQQSRREWWRPLVYAACALLLLEWLVYHRGTLYRMGDSLWQGAWGRVRNWLGVEPQ